jgi:drug/metabolite transporter (DMT)-like permease
VDALRGSQCPFLEEESVSLGLGWSTMVGAASLPLVALSVLLLAALGPDALDLRGMIDPDARLAWFVAVGAFLGVVVSWGGTLLWNGASARLPTSLAGQLIVSETLAGLLYVFVADGRVPSIFEVAGILLVVSGVLIGIRRTSSRGAGEAAPPATDEA